MIKTEHGIRNPDSGIRKGDLFSLFTVLCSVLFAGDGVADGGVWVEGIGVVLEKDILFRNWEGDFLHCWLNCR